MTNSPAPSAVTRGLEVPRFTPLADNELFAEILAKRILWGGKRADLVRFASQVLLNLDADDLAILRKYGYSEKISGKTDLEQAGTLIDDFERAALRWKAAGGDNYLRTEVWGQGYQGKPIRNLLDDWELERQRFEAVLGSLESANLGLGALGYALDDERGALFFGAVGDILSPVFMGIGAKAHFDALARQAHGPQSLQEIHGTKNPIGQPEREAPAKVVEPIEPPPSRRSSSTTTEPAESTPEARGTTMVSKGLESPAPAKARASTAQRAPKAPTQITANAQKRLDEPAIPAKPTWFTKQVGNLRLRAKSWFPNAYVGTSTTGFRAGVLRLLRADPDSEVARALLVDGKFVGRPENYTMEDLERDPRIWEAGHVLSEKEGGRDVIVIQTAYRNQLRGQLGERYGGIVSDFALVIEGFAFDPLSALDLVKAGRLPPSTVRNAGVLRWE